MFSAPQKVFDWKIWSCCLLAPLEETCFTAVGLHVCCSLRVEQNTVRVQISRETRTLHSSSWDQELWWWCEVGVAICSLNAPCLTLQGLSSSVFPLHPVLSQPRCLLGRWWEACPFLLTFVTSHHKDDFKGSVPCYYHRKILWQQKSRRKCETATPLLDANKAEREFLNAY